MTERDAAQYLKDSVELSRKIIDASMNETYDCVLTAMAFVIAGMIKTAEHKLPDYELYLEKILSGMRKSVLFAYEQLPMED